MIPCFFYRRPFIVSVSSGGKLGNRSCYFHGTWEFFWDTNSSIFEEREVECFVVGCDSFCERVDLFLDLILVMVEVLCVVDVLRVERWVRKDSSVGISGVWVIESVLPDDVFVYSGDVSCIEIQGSIPTSTMSHPLSKNQVVSISIIQMVDDMDALRIKVSIERL